MIVPGIERDADLVAVRDAAAASETGADCRCVGRVTPGRDIEELVVVGHLYHGPLARRGQVVRLLLREIVDGVCSEPRLVVNQAVEAGSLARDAERPDLFTRRLLGSGG